jgi:hypothetical protein
MEGILGSSALFYPTRIMVIGPYNGSGNCSPLTQSIRHREGMARRSSDEGEWHFNGLLQPWPSRLCKLRIYALPEKGWHKGS